MASAGLLLLQGGWTLLDGLFGSSGELSPSTPPLSLYPFPRAVFSVATIWPTVGEACWRLTEPVRMLAIPVLSLVTPGSALSQYIHALFAIVWVGAVWGILGGAICRSNLLELSGKRSISLRGPLVFAFRFAVPLIGAPLYPLLATLLLAAGSAAFGILLRLPMGIGGRLGQMLFFIPLVLGVGMALLLLGMLQRGR